MKTTKVSGFVQKSHWNFTLIELLVVIAIIVIKNTMCNCGYFFYL